MRRSFNWTSGLVPFQMKERSKKTDWKNVDLALIPGSHTCISPGSHNYNRKAKLKKQRSNALLNYCTISILTTQKTLAEQVNAARKSKNRPVNRSASRGRPQTNFGYSQAPTKKCCVDSFFSYFFTM